MSFLLQRNLSCFYCGGRSGQKYTAGLQNWHCQKCDAVNYLDTNGAITDPPPPEAPEDGQQANSRPARDGLRSFQPPEGSLFCATCIKNQHLYSEALRAYLPPDDDDDDYDAAYETYKKSLERRYPQVCLDCEPRVRAGIKAAGYKAKTDHLRRMMQASKQSRRWRARQYTWRWLLVTLGSWTWWASVLVQALWHAAAVALVDEYTDDNMAGDDVFDDEASSWTNVVQTLSRGCVRPSSKTWAAHVERHCFDHGTRFVKWSLVAALLSVWWNPRLKEKIDNGRVVRLTGLAEHLWLQVLTIGVRTAAWSILSAPRDYQVPPQKYQAAHFFMVAFLVAAALASLKIVKASPRKQRLFTDDIPQLIPADEADQANAFRQSMGQTRNPVVQKSRAGYDCRKFPISALADAPPLFPHEAPSPPPEDPFSAASTTTTTTTITNVDPDNAMDWVPTPQQTWQPQPALFERPAHAAQERARRSRQQQQRQQQQQHPARPSPFYGALPPRPQAPAAKRVNPYTSIFQRPTQATKENFFAQVMGRGRPNAKPYDDAGARGGGGGGYMELAQPRWRYDDGQSDTGLETMFDTVFSIRDEPAEVLQQKQNKNKKASQARGAGFGSAVPAAAAANANPAAHAHATATFAAGPSSPAPPAWACGQKKTLTDYLLLWGIPVVVGGAVFALHAYGAVDVEVARFW